MGKKMLTGVVLGASLMLSGCSQMETVLDDIIEEELSQKTDKIRNETIDEDGYYSSPEDVALYIHTYDELPDNYLTKDEARELGWEASEGNLWEVTDEMLIGGDYFGNREGLLPEEEGRDYYEADINYDGGYRGAERLVYSNDGLIYYTDDHYDSFQQLYGEDE
ncbi:ribonuclease [Alkalibacterium subtropicum]|uniref:Ribonuclease n=1 Tax=Alkalibacterium subtropicum TaxID=753702 RepID=A0A1I1GIE9_9LACT|nr:ribonuclease domain-containing protein [Alkalibacterium subtropicum]SFC09648.1 ribonuclease [Alkalibacterium subtropicum]